MPISCPNVTFRASAFDGPMVTEREEQLLLRQEPGTPLPKGSEPSDRRMPMRKLLTLSLFLALVATGLSFADPGPNGSNNHGLCTAYFNGSANGQAHKRNAPPFVELAREVGNSDQMDNDGDGQTDEGDEMAGPEG